MAALKGEVIRARLRRSHDRAGENDHEPWDEPGKGSTAGGDGNGGHDGRIAPAESDAVGRFLGAKLVK